MTIHTSQNMDMRTSLVTQTPKSTTHTHVSTHVMIVVDPSHRQCFWDQPSFSGDTDRSNHRWLHQATTTLIVGIKNMKESKTPQQIEDYIHKLQSLGRHMQLRQFRTWLKDQCGLPIAVRPSNLNTKEYMSKEQIEQWIEDWTTQHAQGNERRVLKNFLLMDFAVQPNQKMQPCSNCEQPFMLFMLLPMKQHNMNMYDPDEHKLFCYNCCTEVGQMLHPGRYAPPDQQAIERQKALNQNPPGLTMAECELRALSGDRGYIPPTWYLATPPGAAVPPDHAIIIHRWDTETSQWIKLPLMHQGRRRPRGLAVLSPRMAAFGQTGMASQEGPGSAGTADTSVHNIQEPPRCPHRDSTEPIQEEGQNGPIGSPRIPCHPGRHGPLDPGASTTSAIGEGLSRLGEGQFHTDGYRPQQRPLGLPRAQGQHCPPSGLSGRRAAEPPRSNAESPVHTKVEKAKERGNSTGVRAASTGDTRTSHITMPHHISTNHHRTAFRHNRYSSGNHSPNGTHHHHQSNGTNKPNHPTNSGHPRPAHKTTRTRRGNRKAKEARKGSPNNSGNRDSSEWGPQRPRHPRCHASNSCSGTTLARDLSFTLASSMVLEPHQSHYNTWEPTLFSPSAGRQTHSVRHFYNTISSPYNTEMSPS